MKHFLSFHTIFILDENIKWLEEFLIYYIHIGFDHFYLYDNEGTSGGDGSSTKNKYDFPIDVNNNTENNTLLQKILEKYHDKITYIKWQPRDENGKITYAQTDGIRHFIKNYGHETEWIALLDLDEFIFSQTDVDIRDYLQKLPSEVSSITISQKKFEDRFLTPNDFSITKNFKCINKEIDFSWAPKNIVRCSDFLNIENIHTIVVKNKTIQVDPSILRFNHYNTNDKQLKWMKSFYNSSTDFHLDGIDDGMQKYAVLLEKKPESESFISSNTFEADSSWVFILPSVLLLGFVLSKWYISLKRKNRNNFFS